MSTILETLECVECNIKSSMRISGILPLAEHQIHNAIVLLGKDYGVHTDIEEIIEKYGSVEAAPDLEMF